MTLNNEKRMAYLRNISFVFLAVLAVIGLVYMFFQVQAFSQNAETFARAQEFLQQMDLRLTHTPIIWGLCFLLFILIIIEQLSSSKHNSFPILWSATALSSALYTLYLLLKIVVEKKLLGTSPFYNGISVYFRPLFIMIGLSWLINMISGRKTAGDTQMPHSHSNGENGTFLILFPLAGLVVIALGLLAAGFFGLTLEKQPQWPLVFPLSQSTMEMFLVFLSLCGALCYLFFWIKYYRDHTHQQFIEQWRKLMFVIWTLPLLYDLYFIILTHSLSFYPSAPYILIWQSLMFYFPIGLIGEILLNKRNPKTSPENIALGDKTSV